MSHLNADIRERATELVALYPQPRSALIPLCHLAQEQDGWLRAEAMVEIAELCGVTAAEVRGTATFYDMLHTEPVGTYVVSVCTNIACLLGGALELLEHAESVLGMRAGGRRPTASSPSTRPSAWPTATARRACRSTTATWARRRPRASMRCSVTCAPGALSETVPAHGTLVRVRRSVGLQADRATIVAERRGRGQCRQRRARRRGRRTGRRA